MADIVKITDLSLPGLDPYRNTSELELLKNDPPLLVAESPKVVRTALDAGMQPVSLLTENKYITRQVLSMPPLYDTTACLLKKSFCLFIRIKFYMFNIWNCCVILNIHTIFLDLYVHFTATGDDLLFLEINEAAAVTGVAIHIGIIELGHPTIP